MEDQRREHSQKNRKFRKFRKFKRRTVLKGALATTIGASILSVGTVVDARYIEPTWYEITHYRVTLPRLERAFEGYRLVHITDLHADGEFMIPSRLSSIVKTVNSLRPDAVAITGDFVSYYEPGLENTVATLAALQAPDGVFGVLGNHDHPSGVEWVRQGLQMGKVQELNNRTYTLHRDGQMLHLVGLDDLWPSNRGKPASIWTHQALLQQLTSSLSSEGAAILLVHEPDFADVAAANGRCGLQLSGHSHGGQVRLPLRGPVILPPLSRKYPMGWYKVESLQLYTNRGLGMLAPHVRLNCRPEIAVLELTARASA